MNNSIVASLQKFGYGFHPSELAQQKEMPDVELIYSALNNELDLDPAPGRRHRCYGRLELRGETELTKLPHVAYVQYQNQDARAKPRNFRPMDDKVLLSKTINYWVRMFLPYAKAATPAIFDQEAVKIGLHLVSYRPVPGPGGPSFASPSGFHTDDERFVAVMLLGKTSNLGGGENEIALQKSEVHEIVGLEQPFDTLSVTQACKHNVRAMYTRNDHEARRDILLVTYD